MNNERGKETRAMEALKVFPIRLTKLMKEKRMSHSALAQLLGVSRQAVGNYCNGYSSPSWESIVLIAKEFSCSSDYLLGLSNVSPSGAIEASPSASREEKTFYRVFEHYRQIGVKQSKVLLKIDKDTRREMFINFFDELPDEYQANLLAFTFVQLRMSEPGFKTEGDENGIYTQEDNENR